MEAEYLKKELNDVQSNMYQIDRSVKEREGRLQTANGDLLRRVSVLEGEKQSLLGEISKARLSVQGVRQESGKETSWGGATSSSVRTDVATQTLND